MGSTDEHFKNGSTRPELHLVETAALPRASAIPVPPDNSAIMAMLTELLAERRSLAPEVPLALAQSEFAGWLTSGRARRRSPLTLQQRQSIWDRFTWWLELEGLDLITKTVIESFMIYVAEPCPAGRWGDATNTAETKPSTLLTYYSYLAAYFSYLEKQDVIRQSPFAKVERPPDTCEPIQPLTEDQVRALLKGAQRSPCPVRNTAIITFLLDTGIRISEMCRLNIDDIDMKLYRFDVLGKGRKKRTMYFNETAHAALWRYFNGSPRPKTMPLFVSEGDNSRGKRLTASGTRQMLRRLGVELNLKQDGIRCSPHTLRHTFSVLYLRDGGRERSLMNMLGHTTLKMTSRYVNFTDADIENEIRQHSPADRITNG